MYRFFWFIFLLFAFSAPSFSHDWPQWRGPERIGVYEGGDWSFEAIEDGPEVLWRAQVGIGFSSVSVKDNRAVTMGHVDGNDVVWCFDALTGDELWRHEYEAELGPKYYEGGPGATPTIDDGRVYTISKWGDVFCLDFESGEVLWSHDLGEDPGVEPNEWGFAGAALIYGDLAIFNAGASGAAFDRKSGELIWINGTESTGYASPFLINHDGEDIVLIFAAKHLVAVDPLDGEELWRHPWETGYDNNNADPIVSGGHILITSYDRGAALLELDGDDVDVIYDKQAINTHMAPPVLIDSYLYGFSGHYGRQPDFRCVEFETGEVMWSEPMPAGSVMLADGALLVFDGSGQLIVAEPDPDGFDPLARAQILGGRCWSPPALANGLMYVRNAQGELRCVDLRGE